MHTDTPARIQAEMVSRLRAAGHQFNQSRPGLLVRQYRDSEFHGRTKHAVRVRFRIHLADDPAPTSRRLALVSGWAGLLGLAGTVAALPVLTNLFRRDPGWWYTPLMMLIGLIGVGATAGAFASIHRRRAPWILLWIGTATLGLALTVNALH